MCLTFIWMWSESGRSNSSFNIHSVAQVAAHKPHKGWFIITFVWEDRKQIWRTCMVVKASVWERDETRDALCVVCIEYLFVAFQGDRGETGSPGPAGFAGPPVRNNENAK